MDLLRILSFEPLSEEFACAPGSASVLSLPSPPFPLEAPLCGAHFGHFDSFASFPSPSHSPPFPSSPVSQNPVLPEYIHSHTVCVPFLFCMCAYVYILYVHIYITYVNMCMCAFFRWNRILTVSDDNTLLRFVLLCNSSCRSGHLSGHWECLVVEIAKVFLTYSHLRLCDW